MGAELHYSSPVDKVDHENGTVTLSNGQVFKARNIVITCGSTTDQFYQSPNQFKVRKHLVSCYNLQDNSHLPAAFLLEGLKEADQKIVFGTLEGDNF